VNDPCEHCGKREDDGGNLLILACEGCGCSVCEECAPFGLCPDCEDDEEYDAGKIVYAE